VAKIMQLLLQEIRKEERVDIAPVSGFNRKEKRKMVKKGLSPLVSSEGATGQSSIALLPEWTRHMGTQFGASLAIGRIEMT
jgi:hypothetical protein